MQPQLLVNLWHGEQVFLSHLPVPLLHVSQLPLHTTALQLQVTSSNSVQGGQTVTEQPQSLVAGLQVCRGGQRLGMQLPLSRPSPA